MSDVARPDRLDEFAIAERRHRVSQLYLRRHTKRQIARQLGVGDGTVERDIAALKEEWRRESAGVVAEALERELWELDEMERDAVLQYTRTLQPEITSQSADGMQVTQTLHVGEALPWFLARLKVKERRAKLLGLDKAEKPDGMNLPPWVFDILRMTDDDLERERVDLARVLATSGADGPALEAAPESDGDPEGLEPE